LGSLGGGLDTLGGVLGTLRPPRVEATPGCGRLVTATIYCPPSLPRGREGVLTAKERGEEGTQPCHDGQREELRDVALAGCIRKANSETGFSLDRL
jgi:hypothetical protein